MISRRAFAQAGGLASLAALTGGWRATAAEPDSDVLRHVAPELRPAVRQMLSGPQPVFSDATLPKIRANSRGPDVSFLPVTPVGVQMVPVPGEGADVEVYVINAKPGGSRPGIVYMHGGGFFGGSARSQVPRFQALAAELDCTIVSVEYRLAPEATYRTSVEQTYASLKWLYRNADRLGVDGQRIAVMGESAGGGHAALLALAARDRGEVPVAFQLLVYPMLDDRTGSTRHYASPLGAVGWNAPSNRFGWRCFLGMEPGGENVPTAGVPARRTDLGGLPPTWIGVGGIDLLAPEALDYASRLLQAGVPTELHLVPGAHHGFDKIPGDIGLVTAFAAAKLAALRRAFRSPAG